MGRGRAKGKKQRGADACEDGGSGDEEKIAVRRRGRPQKPMKDDIDEEDEVGKIEEEGEPKIVKSPVLTRNMKKEAAAANGRKRRMPTLAKENADLPMEENEVGNKTEVLKAVGFTQNGSRRKSKPRRAAEVGVECK